MPDLRTFLERLRSAGELAVDARLEIAEIHRRVIASGGPALLFNRVSGADFRLATNLFGTSRRATMAFGERPFELIRRLVATVETLMPPSAGKLWQARDLVREGLRVGIRRRRAGAVTENLGKDAAGLYGASRWTGTQSGDVPAADPRLENDRDALADRQRRRLSLCGGRGAR